MLNGKKIWIIMPAYNAEHTLVRTYQELPFEVVDGVILVDDHSKDATVALAQTLGIITFQHKKNMGYGRNQKTCFREALRHGADIVIMIHPDYQYSPRLVIPLAGMLAYGEYDLALGSRILGVGALQGGMPLYKFVANRCLTAFQNILMNYKLSEYHTGYRAFTRKLLETLPLEQNADDFAFDDEILAQAVYFGFRIGEVSCPTRYFPEASSINFRRSVRYGLSVLATSVKYRLQKWHLGRFKIFHREPGTFSHDYYEMAAPPRDMQSK